MRSLMSRGSGLACAFSSRDSLLVEISRSAATSFRFFPEPSRSCFSAAAMPRRGPSGPVTLFKADSPRRGLPGRRNVAAWLFPFWESHDANVLPIETCCTRHSGAGTTACLRAANQPQPARWAEARITARPYMINSLKILHSGNPKTVSCTTDFSKRDLMATSGHVPPDVPHVVARGIYAIAQGAGRSHLVAARLVVPEAPKARAPPRVMAPICGPGVVHAVSLRQAAGRWVQPSARPTTPAPPGSYRKRNLVETVHCTSLATCLG